MGYLLIIAIFFFVGGVAWRISAYIDMVRYRKQLEAEENKHDQD